MHAWADALLTQMVKCNTWFHEHVTKSRKTRKSKTNAQISRRTSWGHLPWWGLCYYHSLVACWLLCCLNSFTSSEGLTCIMCHKCDAYCMWEPRLCPSCESVSQVEKLCREQGAILKSCLYAVMWQCIVHVWNITCCRQGTYEGDWQPRRCQRIASCSDQGWPEGANCAQRSTRRPCSKRPSKSTLPRIQQNMKVLFEEIDVDHSGLMSMNLSELVKTSVAGRKTLTWLSSRTRILNSSTTGPNSARWQNQKARCDVRQRLR